MKDAKNCFIPAMQHDMMVADISVKCLTGNLSSNGYYGYHAVHPPTVMTPLRPQSPVPPRNSPPRNMLHDAPMDDDNIQFHNYIQPEEEEEMAPTTIAGKKRHWQEDNAGNLAMEKCGGNDEGAMNWFTALPFAGVAPPLHKKMREDEVYRSDAVAVERGADFSNVSHPPPHFPIDTTRRLTMRQPTHNIPDMSRGLMGHYI